MTSIRNITRLITDLSRSTISRIFAVSRSSALSQRPLFTHTPPSLVISKERKLCSIFYMDARRVLTVSAIIGDPQMTRSMTSALGEAIRCPSWMPPWETVSEGAEDQKGHHRLLRCNLHSSCRPGSSNQYCAKCYGNGYNIASHQALTLVSNPRLGMFVDLRRRFPPILTHRRCLSVYLIHRLSRCSLRADPVCVR